MSTPSVEPIDTAPQDGTPIIGVYGTDPREECELRWAEERHCVLASVAPGAGLFGPGWEDTLNGLAAEDPLWWRPVSGGEHA
jgi:hypothetical protein